jgi:hypothetical protein
LTAILSGATVFTYPERAARALADGQTKEVRGQPGFLGLSRYAAPGIGSIKDSPNRLEQAREAGEKAGVRPIGM